MIFNTAIVFGKTVITLSNLRSYDEFVELPNLMGWILIRLILTLIAIYNANLVIQEANLIITIQRAYEICLFFILFSFALGQKNVTNSA